MVTFFKKQVNRHTNFGMEMVQQTFTNTVAFGNEVQVTLNRCGDLLSEMFVEVHLPAITAVWNKRTGNGGYGICCAYAVEDACDPCADGVAPCAPCDENKRHTKVQGGVFGEERIERRGHSGYSEYGSSSSDYYGDSTSSSRSSSSSGGSSGSSGSSSGYGSSSGSSSDSSTGSSSRTDSCTGIRGPWAHWVNNIGFALIERASCSIGGQVVDIEYGQFMNIWEELSSPPGKRLREMTGNFNTVAECVEFAAQPRTLYVPLKFWFTQDYADALPLVSLQFHMVQISVTFAALEKCIVVSHEDVQVVRCVDGAVVTKTDINAHLDSRYIYLDMEERDCFACGSFTTLIKQVQTFTQTASRTNNCHAILNFNHPCAALYWFIQRRCNVDRGRPFDYSGAFGRDPITNVSLTLNSLPVFNHEASYFRLVEPYTYMTNIPKNFIYMYSFALHPESNQPSGSINFSRIDSIEMSFCFQNAIAHEDLAICVFAQTWNFLKVKDGLGGLMYSSNPVCVGSNLAVNWI
jgi:hypothetical protein